MLQITVGIILQQKTGIVAIKFANKIAPCGGTFVAVIENIEPYPATGYVATGNI